MASEFQLAQNRWQQHWAGLTAEQKQQLRMDAAADALVLDQQRFSMAQKKLWQQLAVEKLPLSLQLAGRLTRLYLQAPTDPANSGNLMRTLATELVPGQDFRNQSCALYSDHKLLFQAPAAEQIPQLFARWGQAAPRTLAGIASHYQKWMQLQPFSAGNQLLALLWLKLMLRQLHPSWYELPLEQQLKKQQAEYQKLLWQDGAAREWTDWLQQQLHLAIRAALPEEPAPKIQRNWFDTEDEIVRQLKKDNRLSARQLALQLGLSCRAIEKQLAKLKARGQLQRVGPAKGGRWLIQN
ncbi:HTH domain-containing protein [Rheinheimera sp.]|uniref:HTH domain-containing protein n=1 Tax=Rheinheimera sp. TaxID=1869214 RepID=UPI00307ED776